MKIGGVSHTAFTAAGPAIVSQHSSEPTGPKEKFESVSPETASQAAELRALANSHSDKMKLASLGTIGVLGAECLGVALNLSIPTLCCMAAPIVALAATFIYQDRKAAALYEQADKLDGGLPAPSAEAVQSQPALSSSSDSKENVASGVGLDGSLQVRIGDTTIFSNGTSVTRTEDTWYSSNGLVSQRVGDAFLRSDGVSEFQVGDYIIRSDGTSEKLI